MESEDTIARHLSEIDHLLRIGDASSALARARQSVEEFGETAEVKIRLALALEATGARAQAIATLEQITRVCDSAGAAPEAIRYAKHLLGGILNSERRFKEAAALLSEAIEAGGDYHDATALYAAAGKAFWGLGDVEQSRKWGQKCLETRDREVANSKLKPVSSIRPRNFDPAKPERNVIAYSLFGEDRYYHDCALLNARIAVASFPDFRCRFYCGEEVPKRVLNELLRLNAQVKIVKNRVSPWEGLFWRFWALDDPEVDVALFRDVDSPLTPRERVAVEDWLDSDAPFHVMRDHPFHCEPIMAGLWGGFSGLLPPMKKRTGVFLRNWSNRYADQTFLRYAIWPQIRDATLAHDSNFVLRNSRDFPPYGRVCHGVHVGWSWPAKKDRRSLI